MNLMLFKAVSNPSKILVTDLKSTIHFGAPSLRLWTVQKFLQRDWPIIDGQNGVTQHFGKIAYNVCSAMICKAD